VILQVCDEAGDVDDGHGRSSWFPGWVGARVVVRPQARSVGAVALPRGG
jgi:hypothetical protein